MCTLPADVLSLRAAKQGIGDDERSLGGETHDQPAGVIDQTACMTVGAGRDWPKRASMHWFRANAGAHDARTITRGVGVRPVAACGWASTVSIRRSSLCNFDVFHMTIGPDHPHGVSPRARGRSSLPFGGPSIASTERAIVAPLRAHPFCGWSITNWVGLQEEGRKAKQEAAWGKTQGVWPLELVPTEQESSPSRHPFSGSTATRWAKRRVFDSRASTI